MATINFYNVRGGKEKKYRVNKTEELFMKRNKEWSGTW